MKKLFIDDYREPWGPDWDLVKSYKEMVEYIDKHGMPDVVSFDHDLHSEHYMPSDKYDTNYTAWSKSQNFRHKTGQECAEYICKYCVENGIKIPKSFVHSANPQGASNIAGTLMDYNLFYFEEEINNPLHAYSKGDPITNLSTI